MLSLFNKHGFNATRLEQYPGVTGTNCRIQRNTRMHCSGGSFANERPMPAVHQSASIPISKRPCHLSHEFVSVAEAFSHLPLERMLRPEANVFTGCPKAQSKMHFRSSSDYVQHKAVPKYKRKKRVDREKKLFPVGTSISGVEEVFIPEM